jgi:hypothetical protein
MNIEDFFSTATVARSAGDDLNQIAHVERTVSEQLGRIAFQQYPALGDMDADLLRRFGTLVSRTAGRFATDLESISFEAWRRRHEQ